MEFSLLMTDIPVYLSCMSEMLKNAIVINENVRCTFLFVLGIEIM